MATSWTDPTLSDQIKIKAVHINELKTAVQNLINRANLSSSVKIGTINTSAKVLKLNVANLQKSINALQSSFSRNCVRPCQSDKCESCQDSCTQCSCQSSTCQTCQTCQRNCYDGCYDGCSSSDNDGDYE